MSAATGAAQSTGPSPAKQLRALKDSYGTKGLWTKKAKPKKLRGVKVGVRAKRFRALSLDTADLRSVLARAPRERNAAAKNRPVVLSLPAPNGTFQKFALQRSAVMAPGLAKKHPEIRTYSGRGITDLTATIHADLSPLGFHASVRSSQGAWYIDPYYVGRTPGLYASYFGKDVENMPPFIERDAQGAELSVDEGYYHAADTVEAHGHGFAENAAITITISDPEEHFASRTVRSTSDELGSFDTSFVADPDGNLDTHFVEASDGSASAFTSYQVISDEDSSKDPPTGDVLRTYRLAMITDPGYATYFGGPANVTAAKVALMNRVSQVYEDDLTIRLQLIANNDLLNLDTWDEAIGPNGPCGTAGCFTLPQVTGCSNLARNRIVIGQIIGASNYDIGHLALGQPGGGVANLGVVGRASKAGGCTGLTTPVGDFYAVDYVAHEMGHQFAGNHPFNGNQLNCSGGNRSAANSVEPGSGSSVMAYAGICLTDDLQPHSDPYFSQRSQQEITTYVASEQPPINEAQTVSLRHFGGGNEVQVVTFGPGYATTSAIAPAVSTINAAPSATSRGGAQQNGNTVTIATAAGHTLQPGDTVTIAGVGVADYNGTFTVTAVPTTRSFQYTNPVTGLPVSGGGTVTPAVPGASSSGTTATIRTSLLHNRSVGDVVTIAGVGAAGYNGTHTITAVPSPRTFQYELPAPGGLVNSGGGSATYFSPFRVRIGGNDSQLIGGTGLPYNSANLTTAINAIPGFAGTVAVTGAASTGFTITYSDASANTDVPNIELVGLSCGGCFASVEETNHGGAFDSFRLNYNGVLSTPIVNGSNYTAAGIQAALLPLLPAGGTVTVTPFGSNNPGTILNTGFQVSYGGTLALANNPVLLGVEDFTSGASGFVNETDKGGAVDNRGAMTPTGNNWPVVTVPAGFTIPLRTPFALTANATDAEGDTILYAWEQNDRGGLAGTSLLNNTKTNGPLFAMFPRSAPISEEDTLKYNSPNENHVTTSPTRVFPDLEQILANNTNADTGACPAGPIAPPVPIPVKECFSEFLPTADYLGTTGVNPLQLHFRVTARDLRMGGGGNSAADLTLLLAPTAGPFRVTSPDTAVSYPGGSVQTVTWNVANTDLAPVGTTDVKISLSADGGRTYPHVLAASTGNDGSEAVTIPNVATSGARVKIEALGNVFFDVSNTNFTTTDTVAPTISAAVTPDANAAGWWKTNPTVTLTAEDDTHGSGVDSITYSAAGAQPIAQTTVAGATASVVMRAEGVTTLSFHATDKAANESDVGTVTIRLDKTAPEAFLRFDPAAKDMAVFGRDALSGIGSGAVAPEPAGTRSIDRPAVGSQTRVYMLVDTAGNTLRLVNVTRRSSSSLLTGIQSLQYNGGPLMTPRLHAFAVDWDLKKKTGSFDKLEQALGVLSPLQAATAAWRAKDNKTRIVSFAGGRVTKSTVPGMFLLRLATDRGALRIETTP